MSNFSLLIASLELWLNGFKQAPDTKEAISLVLPLLRELWSVASRHESEETLEAMVKIVEKAIGWKASRNNSVWSFERPRRDVHSAAFREAEGTYQNERMG